MTIYRKFESKRTKFFWLFRRLRAMSVIEVLIRIQHTIRIFIWRKRQVWNVPHPKVRIDDTWMMPELNADTEEERALLIIEADEYIAGRYTLLNISFEMKKIDWHLDVETGIRSPMTFASDIDYRDPGVAGNVKNIWELNRHRHISVLATAYALTSDERYALVIERQLHSWVKHNPFLKGVNWHSVLELGIRLIAWVWTERLLRGCSVHDRLFGPEGFLWPTIYRHQWLIAKLKSVGSSANNHLVGELTGQYIASTVWPYFQESARWQRESQTLLEREIKLQTYESGINREQAFSYHRFSLELFLLVAIEAEKSNIPLSKAYLKMLRRMIEVIPDLTDIGGNFPSYGDEDGGTALQLQPRESSPFDWIYRLGMELLQAHVPTPKGNSGLLAAKLIATQLKTKNIHSLPSIHHKAFKDAGLFILSAARGKTSEIFCLADAGDLGFLSLAAHGHADALSFTLSVGGQPVIVDPGTYKYFNDSNWRRYFRSTRAHNTICVDSEDQSELGGSFLWGRKARCKVLNWLPASNSVELFAEHDGYVHLHGKVMHRRKLVFTANDMAIIDSITGAGNHEIEWRLHFGPACNVSLENNCCMVNWDNGSIKIELSESLQWDLEKGTHNAGWYSPVFNVKVPTTTLIGYKKAALPQTIQNTIHFH